MKITKDQDLILKEFRKSMTIEQIKTITGLPYSTIVYHTNPKCREGTIRRQKSWYNKLSPEKKKEHHKKNYDNYGKNYMKRRYHEDEEFRKRMIQSVIKSKKKRALKGGKTK